MESRQQSQTINNSSENTAKELKIKTDQMNAKTTQENAELRARIDALELKLITDLDQVTARIAQQTAELKAKIDTLESKADDLKARIDTLETRHATIREMLLAFQGSQCLRTPFGTPRLI